MTADCERSSYVIFINFIRAKDELNDEATRCLKEIPEEMLFHTSNLHLLDTVGQGSKIFEHVCCILTLFSSFSHV